MPTHHQLARPFSAADSTSYEWEYPVSKARPRSMRSRSPLRSHPHGAPLSSRLKTPANALAHQQAAQRRPPARPPACLPPPQQQPDAAALLPLRQVTYPHPKVEIGHQAPDFSVTALVGSEIKTVSLKDYHGKWVVLFFYPKACASALPLSRPPPSHS